MREPDLLVRHRGRVSGLEFISGRRGYSELYFTKGALPDSGSSALTRPSRVRRNGSRFGGSSRTKADPPRRAERITFLEAKAYATQSWLCNREHDDGSR